MRLLFQTLVCALVLGGLGYVPAMAQDESAPAPKVSIAAVISKDITDQATFIAKGEAVDEVDIIARVEGYLRSTLVEDGAEIAKDELLFEIEPEQYEANLASHQADLARANANLKLAEIELERKRTLVERDAVAQSELDVAQANAAVAEADIKAAQAAINQAELELSYTQIKAPFAGRIGRVGRSVGDLVGPTTGTLVTLVSEAPIYVTFSISERVFTDFVQQAMAEAGSTESSIEGQPVYVILPNGTQLDEVGHIVFADNRIDPTTGTMTIRAEFENTNKFVVDGAFVQVRIEASEPTPRVLVPQAAVQRDQRGEFVLVVNDQQIVEQRYITVGDTVEESIIVTDGLREGESVIVEGLQRVRPGVPVDAVLAGTEG